jgi:hypothetical protein
MLQPSHIPGTRATKALQDSTLHNIISADQGIVSMNWRTACQSNFTLKHFVILVYSEWFVYSRKRRTACVLKISLM